MNFTDIIDLLIPIANLVLSSLVVCSSLWCLQTSLVRYSILLRIAFVLIPMAAALSVSRLFFDPVLTAAAAEILMNVGLLFFLSWMIDSREEFNLFAYYFNDQYQRKVGIVGRTIIEFEFIIMRMWNRIYVLSKNLLMNKDNQ